MLRENRKFKVGGSSGRDSFSSSHPLARQTLARWLVLGVAIGLLGFLSIAAVCPFSLFGIGGIGGAYAEEMTLSAILTPSITLSMSSSVSESIEPTVDGSFKNLATVARVQVMNSEYYDVSISGNPDMVGTANPEAKIAAIAGQQTAANFAANTWGYNVSKNDIGVTTAVAANANTIYKPVPATSTQIVSRQATTNNAADDYYSLNFGAKVDTNIPADTYTSRVMLSVTASPVLATEYTLAYDGNGATGGTVPTKQTASSYDQSYEFTVVGNTGTTGSNGLTKTGYTFLGWADASDATEVQYTAGSKVTVTEANKDKTVYAVWRIADPFNGITTMQEMTPEICKAAEEGDTTRLKDTRDDKIYWVAKLPDDNCWTTQNMDYEIPGKSTAIGTARSSDGGYFWENGLKVMNTPSGSATTTVDSTWTASTDVDFYTKNGNSAVDVNNKIYDAHYSTGNYYQFSAAPIVCTGIGSQWALPTSNQADTVNGSFNKLVKESGQDTSGDSWILAKPYFFPRAGIVGGSDGKQYFVGSYGYYWSSTPGSTTDGYNLYFGSSSVSPSDWYSRYNGYSVRCYVNGN